MRCAVSLLLIEIVFLPKGDDQRQNSYRRKVCETWLESKVALLKCLRTTNVQNSWNRLWCRNCLIGFPNLLFRCFLKLTKSAITNPFDIDIGCVFTTTIVSLINITGGVLFTDFVKQLKNDSCFHELFKFH